VVRKSNVKQTSTRDDRSKQIKNSPELELGAGLTLGASVISTQLNVPLCNNTQLSKIPSPTSATTILIVFTLSFGVPCAVRIIVKPSGSICG
jgi:hypothetical protein